MDFNEDYQTVLINLAGEVSILIASNGKRKYFQEQVQKFIDAFDNWKEKLIEGQRAVKDDPKLNIGKEPMDDGSEGFLDNQVTDKWWRSVQEKKPVGYEIYSANSFYNSDYVIDGIEGYYYAPKLPPNPVETLRPTELLPLIFSEADTPIKERMPIDVEEDLMRKYFLLAVIQSYNGDGFPLLKENHEAESLVWDMYETEENCLKAKIRNLLKTALCDVSADLVSVKTDLGDTKAVMNDVNDDVGKKPKKTGGQVGRPRKYSDDELRRMRETYEDFYKEMKSSKAAWNKVAKIFNAPTGDAARIACLKLKKSK